jgi:hypothetical protein
MKTLILMIVMGLSFSYFTQTSLGVEKKNKEVVKVGWVKKGSKFVTPIRNPKVWSYYNQKNVKK